MCLHSFVISNYDLYLNICISKFLEAMVEYFIDSDWEWVDQQLE